MNRTIFMTVLMVMVATVYPSAKAMAQDQKPLIDYVQSLQMAEDILKPRARQLTITRDPFKPIVTPAPKPKISPFGKKAVARPEDRLKDVLVIGIVRLDQEYRAYIKVGSKARVVNLQDTVRKFVIVGMDMDEVIFKSGHKIIIKKRGLL